jgi:hypothetical protein
LKFAAVASLALAGTATPLLRSSGGTPCRAR